MGMDNRAERYNADVPEQNLVARSGRVYELLEANNKLVLENRELKSRLHNTLSDTGRLAKELARALRALDGYGYLRRSPDVDTKGGFDVVSDQRRHADCGCAYLEHPPGEHREHQAGFDVGWGRFVTGDWCRVGGRYAKILNVLQDGEAEIEYLDRQCATVKWRQVSPVDTVSSPHSAGGTRRCFP